MKFSRLLIFNYMKLLHLIGQKNKEFNLEYHYYKADLKSICFTVLSPILIKKYYTLFYFNFYQTTTFLQYCFNLYFYKKLVSQHKYKHHHNKFFELCFTKVISKVRNNYRFIESYIFWKKMFSFSYLHVNDVNQKWNERYSLY